MKGEKGRSKEGMKRKDQEQHYQGPDQLLRADKETYAKFMMDIDVGQCMLWNSNLSK